MSLLPRTNGVAVPVKNRLRHFAEGAVAAGVHMHMVENRIGDTLTNMLDQISDFDPPGGA